MTSCRELEFSCSIQITKDIYSKLSKKKFTKSAGAEKILKIICHDNLRILIDDESSQYQLKTAQYRKEDLLYFLGFFLSSRLTLSTETNIDAISTTDIGTLIDCYGTDAAADKRIITRIERCYFFDAATNIRHSIEYDTSLDIYRYNFEYEFDNSSVHVEMNDTDLINSVKCNYTSMFNHFKTLCKKSITLYDILEIVFDSKCTIMDILKLDCDLSRPFSNKKNNNDNNTSSPLLPVYYAPKLDGIKHFCILNGYTLQLLYENKFVNFTPVFKQQQAAAAAASMNKFRTMFKQTIIGNVEIVNDKMYLIDILYVLNSVGIYTKIKHYDAVLILNKLKHNLSILVDKKNDLSAATTTTEEEYIEINDYSTDLNFIKSIIEKNPKNYDGWLEINENCIIKKKTYDTIDLLLAQNRTLKKKLNVEKMLRFMHGEFFYKTGYKLGEFNMRLVDQRDNARQFYIFEFTVNTVLKRIDFLRARTDKSVPNTLKCFNEMINNNNSIKV